MAATTLERTCDPADAETFRYVDPARGLLLAPLGIVIVPSVQIFRFGWTQPPVVTAMETSLIVFVIWIVWLAWHRRHQIQVNDEGIWFWSSPVPPPWSWLQKRLGIVSQPPILWRDVTAAEIEIETDDRSRIERIVFHTVAGSRRVIYSRRSATSVTDPAKFLRAVRRRVPLDPA